MRQKLVTVLLVPVLALPLVVIAGGGDLEVIWQEIAALTHASLVVAVYAQGGSPPVGPSPSATIGPLGAPVLTQWGLISASVVLALVALWALNRRLSRS